MSVPNQPVVVVKAASTWPSRKLAFAVTLVCCVDERPAQNQSVDVNLKVRGVPEVVTHGLPPWLATGVLP